MGRRRQWKGKEGRERAIIFASLISSSFPFLLRRKRRIRDYPGREREVAREEKKEKKESDGRSLKQVALAGKKRSKEEERKWKVGNKSTWRRSERGFETFMREISSRGKRKTDEREQHVPTTDQKFSLRNSQSDFSLFPS